MTHRLDDLRRWYRYYCHDLVDLNDHPKLWRKTWTRTPLEHMMWAGSRVNETTHHERYR